MAAFSTTAPVLPPMQNYTNADDDQTYVRLIKVQGDLQVTGTLPSNPYEAYFHIPVSYEHQVPVYLEVEGSNLIDFRFVRLNSPNIMLVTTLSKVPCTISWDAWVFVLEEDWGDLPEYVQIPVPSQLPDSVLKWLVPTDCAQIDDPVVQSAASMVLGSTDNLMELADSIYSYCFDIPWQFPHNPVAFDAYYTLVWGNSCTGHAHAAAALFRANGVPARTLMNCVLSSAAYDHHWAIDFFIPEYGWMRMDPSLSFYPYPPYWEVVTLVCNPEDEFPIWFLPGCEASWHTSDPALIRNNPNWGLAHSANPEKSLLVPEDSALIARELMEEIFQIHTDVWGLPLGFSENLLREQAYAHQEQAVASIMASNFGDCLNHLQASLDLYQSIDMQLVETFLEENFETGIGGWTHGGDQDEWELGIPSCGPAGAHSGDACWGTDLDNDYESNADNWLLSPEISLPEYSSVFFEFWIWNRVDEQNPYLPVDKCWVEITTDGISFEPICSMMAGINEDPEIPIVGGWSHVVLDIHRYAGEMVRIRFRFASNGSINKPGTYIDDVSVYGRTVLETGITHEAHAGSPGLICYPNPCRGFLSIQCSITEPSRVSLNVFDITGRLIATPVEGWLQQGDHTVTWDCVERTGELVPTGLYFVRLETGGRSVTSRVVVAR